MIKRLILTLCLSLIVGVVSSFAPDPVREEVEAFVEKWWNVPYVYGGNSLRGIDCSAFTQRFYKDIFGKKIPRTARSQYYAMNSVPKDSIQTGDLVFFSSRLSPSGWHVGVYLWNDSFVHAANRKEDIKISALSDSSYQKAFKGAKRL
jgi:probable lipoprotein NlpC